MAFVVLLALIVDRLVGEPRRFHPLVGYGKLAQTIENYLYTYVTLLPNPSIQRAIGVAAVVVAVLPIVVLVAVLTTFTGPFGMVLNLVLLYLCIGARSLTEHATRVSEALKAGDLQEARKRVSLIVSRDTSELSETDVARAAVESVLENGSDAIFGAIFWFVFLGAPGAVMYRLVNTLDAMWGYKNAKYLYFGWAAAKFDDLLNYLPARLTALSYMLAGNVKNARHCWQSQAKEWYSPNAGPVMATGAGALSVQLGGPASYHGTVKERPWLGVGGAPGPEDIDRAVKLVDKVLLSWALIVAIAGMFAHA